MKLKNNSLGQKGAIQFIVLLILLAGVAGGVFLATREEPFKLFPQAKVSRPIPKPTMKPGPTPPSQPIPLPTKPPKPTKKPTPGSTFTY